MRYASIDTLTGAPQNERLLLEAYVLPPAEAARSWRRWREDLDPDLLDPEYFKILPMAVSRLGDALDKDPAGNMIRGITRRAWARNQVAFRSLADVVRALRKSGISPVVVIGSAAWAVLHAESKAVRPVEALEFLLRRTDAGGAMDTIRKLGWEPLAGEPQPQGQTLDLREGIWFRNQDDDRLKLSWRLLPSPPAFAASREAIPELVPAEILDLQVELLPPEEMLLDALCCPRDPQQVSWQWDALALLAARPVDWKRMNRLLRDEPGGRERLHELQADWQAAVPPEVLQGDRKGWWSRRLLSIWSDYCWNAWDAGKRPGALGLAGYCIERWWKVFVAGTGGR